MIKKNLFKVAGILAIISAFVYFFTVIGALIGAFLFYVGLIISTYHDAPDEMIIKDKKELLKWTIIVFILSPIAGIFALIAYNSIPDELPTLIEEKKEAPKKIATKKTTTKKATTNKKVAKK